MYEQIEKPKTRSPLRRKAGHMYYGLKRKLLWVRMRKVFARTRQEELLPYSCFSHHTPLLRKLKDVDMYLQYNKIDNLKIAVPCVDGILLRPGEVFSYWRLIGNPSAKKGYKEGMVLVNGTVKPGVGGGLCQLSNLIFWMTIHTPLTIVERHRHGYDVFPDSNRTQPFGSGATCFYPFGDLMIRNDTPDTYQLCVHVGDEYLEGEWRATTAPVNTYKIEERNHEIRSEFWGGYSRHNELVQQVYSPDQELISEKVIVRNSAILMYAPFLESGNSEPDNAAE